MERTVAARADALVAPAAALRFMRAHGWRLPRHSAAWDDEGGRRRRRAARRRQRSSISTSTSGAVDGTSAMGATDDVGGRDGGGADDSGGDSFQDFLTGARDTVRAIETAAAAARFASVFRAEQLIAEVADAQEAAVAIRASDGISLWRSGGTIAC